ncbi:ABC transporter ATP-binding protein [Cryptosporangium sp. NPDC051539]|uniref:ABC transporter ATP-binding protein n=1 Tax=Cryptosporangium sp. NPDC051539 TaxID=3363962 RepID=UPI00378E9499
MSSLLEIQDLTVRYGAVVAVDDVSLDITAGTLVGLIGPNGAGKTTLIDAVCGFCPSRGRVTLGGRRIDVEPAFRRVRLGLARTFQAGELFDDLSVADNILLGSFRGRIVGAFREVLRCRPLRPGPDVLRIAELFGLSDVMDSVVGEVSVGTRKLVAVARALAGSPRILMLDEPAAGLDSTESKALGSVLRRLTETGLTLLLVDHDMDLVLDSCDAVHVLDSGRLIASGAGPDIRRNQRVVEAYLGAPTIGDA